MNQITEYKKKHSKIIKYFFNKGYFDWLCDSSYLKIKYRFLMGKKLDLDNPKTLNEKLNWLKLHNRNPLFTTLVDKVAVKEYVRKKYGAKYIIPTIGVYSSLKEIDIDSLPNQFVIKPNHDSGTYLICQDKNTFDWKSAKKILNRALKRNFYKMHRAWPYKNVHRKILCEKMLPIADGRLPIDYKFFCFDGKADCVMLCLDRDTPNARYYFFDKNWNLLRYNVAGRQAPNDFTLPKPAKISKMFEFAANLSKDMQFVRIDLYYENDNIYFGEYTFFPDDGFDYNLLVEADYKLGQKIQLKEYTV